MSAPPQSASQRALTRYYLDAGAGGLGGVLDHEHAVAVGDAERASGTGMRISRGEVSRGGLHLSAAGEDALGQKRGGAVPF